VVGWAAAVVVEAAVAGVASFGARAGASTRSGTAMSGVPRRRARSPEARAAPAARASRVVVRRGEPAAAGVAFAAVAVVAAVFFPAVFVAAVFFPADLVAAVFVAAVVVAVLPRFRGGAISRLCHSERRRRH